MNREELTFAQAEGAEPLPSQLSAKTISPELAALLWEYLNALLDHHIAHDGFYGGGYSIEQPWNRILQDWWVRRLYRNADEFPGPLDAKRLVKDVVTSRDYVRTFDFVQFVIRHKECPPKFSRVIDDILEKARSAYRIVGTTIVPVASPEEATAIRQAMTSVAQSSMNGARTHLQAAADELSAGNWAGAIRESIHAVEAASKVLEPTADTLGPALDRMQRSGQLKPALKKAFGALYGFSSDEQGVRHSLVFESEPEVTERDALFMFGACAAFVSYLVRGATA